MSRQRIRLFRWVIAGVALPAAAGCAPPMLSVDDAVALNGKPVMFVAHAERPQVLGLRSEIEHVTISFRVDDREIRRADTGDSGRAVAEFPLPRPGITAFDARAVIDGRELQTTGTIFAWSAERPIIAVDIDNTICRTEYEDLILKAEDVESHPIPGSRETLTRLSGDFHIAYVTGRPRIYLEKTRAWLRRNEFPPGPVVTSPRLRDMIKYRTLKRTMLANLRRRWPNLLIGIGDEPLDADAYGANGMLALIVNPGRKHAYGLHAIVLGDWASVDRFFDLNREILIKAEGIAKVANGEIPLERYVQPWRNTNGE
ncbi:MAG: hypothetical protein ACPMAQ_00610 [Phycisphaerae bacterium]